MTILEGNPQCAAREIKISFSQQTSYYSWATFFHNVVSLKKKIEKIKDNCLEWSKWTATEPNDESAKERNKKTVSLLRGIICIFLDRISLLPIDYKSMFSYKLH